MTTNYHTPIVTGASNAPSTVNTPLGELDAAITPVVPLGVAFTVNTNTQRIGLWKATGSYALDVQGAINATAITVNGQPIGTSSDTYFDAVTGGITYGSKVGIGTGTDEPAAPLEVVGSVAATIKSTVSGTFGGSDINGPNEFYTELATSSNDGTVRNCWSRVFVTGTHDVATMAGFYAQTYDDRTAGTATHSWGLVGRYLKRGNGGDALQSAGLYVDYQISGTGTVAGAYGIYMNPGVVSAGTVTNAFMMDLNEPVVSGSGAVGGNYGIRIGACTVGANSNYGLYIEPTATGGNDWGIYSDGANKLYNGGAAIIGGTLDVGDDTEIIGDLTVYSDASVGSELVTNGAFSSDTSGWTGSNATLASVSGGQSGNCLQVTSTSTGNRYAYTSVTTVVGKLYRLQFYHKRGTANQAVYVGTSIGGTQNLFANLTLGTDWTLNTHYFVATATTTYIGFAFSGSPASGATSLWDEVSVEEALGGNLKLNGKVTSYGGTTGMQVAENGDATFDRHVIAEGGLRTGVVSLADDTAINLRSEFPNLGTGGMLLVSTRNYANTAAVISYRATTSPFCTIVSQPASEVTVGTSALAGTTGTDVRLNVAATAAGELWLENRRGATADFIVTVLTT